MNVVQVSYTIDRSEMNKLKDFIGTNNPVVVTNEAFSLLNWVVNNIKKNRFIFSADTKDDILDISSILALNVNWDKNPWNKMN